jgi:hypothetical protein
MAAKVISLPMGPYLSAESAQTVADTLLMAAGAALSNGDGSAMRAQPAGAATAAPVMP